MDLVSKSKYRGRNSSLRGAAFGGLTFYQQRRQKKVMLRVERNQKENVTVIF